jgi:hypothetical protein
MSLVLDEMTVHGTLRQLLQRDIVVAIGAKRTLFSTGAEWIGRV